MGDQTTEIDNLKACCGALFEGCHRSALLLDMALPAESSEDEVRLPKDGVQSIRNVLKTVMENVDSEEYTDPKVTHAHEMYEALNELVRALGDEEDTLVEAIIQARDALAKAEGRGDE